MAMQSVICGLVTMVTALQANEIAQNDILKTWSLGVNKKQSW